MWKKKEYPNGMSKRQQHDYNRKRPYYLNVNISEREKQEYLRRVYLTGRTKREYMLQSALTHQVAVNGNHHLYNRVDERLCALEGQLKDLAAGIQTYGPLLEELRTIYELTEIWK